MKMIIPALLSILIIASSAFSQAKSNDSVARQISVLKAEKTITIEYDQSGNTSKLLAVAENFSNYEAKRSGLIAMNFAAGIIYAGNALQKSPERILVTFWVISKKPRFAESHDLRIFVGQEVLVIGNGRYSARARENMEYLNFEISREHLAAIAIESNVRFVLGDNEFTFTREHLKTFADILMISDVPTVK